MRLNLFTLLAVAFFLWVAGLAQAQTPILPPGDGTEQNPYRISELGHLAWLSQNPAYS